MRSRDRITTVAGLAALAVGVLAIGGAPRWAVVAIAGLAVVAAAAQVGSRRRLDGRSPLLVILGIATGLTALQLVPLPDGLRAWLSPATHELIEDGETLLRGGAPAEPATQVTIKIKGARGTFTGPFRPLSADPPATRTELAELAGLLLLAWMALRACSTERGRKRLLGAVALTAGLVALIGAAHELVGAETLFGVYDPAHANPLVLAPLLNPNHLGCLMALGALVAAGLAVAERRVPSFRAVWILIAIGCVGVAIATRSRGAIVGLSAGATIAAVIMVVQRMRGGPGYKKRDVLRVAVPAAVIVLCTLVLVVLVGGGEVSQQLESTRLAELSDPRSKYAAWESALELVDEAPVLGVGRGGFESAFTRVHPASSQLTFSHVENEYLQAVVDWGIGGALALAVGLALVLVGAARRWRDGPLAAAALGGLAAVAVQSIVDFGLELPGVAIPVVIVAATVLHVPLQEASSSRRRTGLRLAVVGGAAVAAIIAATPLGRTLREDHEAFRTELPTLAEARAALARHPLDYVAAGHVARAADDDRQRLAFLNFALRLHPSHPGLHRAAARFLATIGRRAQAGLEYRLAIAGSGAPETLIAEVLAVLPDAADAARALPLDHVLWNRIVTALVEARREDVAIAYLVTVTSARPDSPVEVWRRLLGLAEARSQHEVAERAAIALARIDPTVASTIAVARIQLARGAHDLAIVTLTPVATELVTSREHVDARFLLCEVHMARLTWEVARTCLVDTLSAPGVTMDLRRKVHARLATVETALGNAARAEFERKLANPGREPASGVDAPSNMR